MGLDMYLTKKTYVKNWDYDPPETRTKVIVKKNGKSFHGIVSKRITYITEEIGYWRKANAIHQWFVNNVQDGNDDCGYYNVSHEQLQELLDVCKQVIDSSELVNGIIKDNKIAQKLLPSQSGFFFGSTDYDRFYLNDVKETIKIIETELKSENQEAELCYHSSW